VTAALDQAVTQVVDFINGKCLSELWYDVTYTAWFFWRYMWGSVRWTIVLWDIQYRFEEIWYSA
jgi:chromosome condensin MukBEF ATPase and DNA-binding subunit MukB